MNASEKVFRRHNDGKLEFIGDFEALYQSEEDPWAQSTADERMGTYYAASRARLIAILGDDQPLASIVEIGCGLGQVCALIAKANPDARVVGLDVSPTAIVKARTRHRDIEFYVADARLPWPKKAGSGFDIALVNQMVWYVLEELEDVLLRAIRNLRPGGRLIVQQAFLRGDQEYGREIVDGFQGLLDFFIARHLDGTWVERADLLEDVSLTFNDGIVVLRKPESCGAS